MLTVVGCGSDQEPAPAAAADATSSVDQVDPPDSVEAQKAACEAKNSDCTKAYWTNTGTCVLEVNLGAACGSGPAECRGTCDADGQCVQPGPEKACGKGAPECSRCDGKGACSFYTLGAACTVPALSACKSGAGVCSGLGVCTGTVNEGIPCPIANPLECTESNGICGANGACKPVPKTAGIPCSVVDPKQCAESTGTCDGTGYCAPVSKAAGSPCAVAKPSACIESMGTCGDNGQCAPVPKTAGSPCAFANPSMCTDSTGVCDASGKCTPVPMAAGSPCPIPNPSSCIKSTGGCGTDGSCQPLPKPAGTACASGYLAACVVGPGACTADGQCKVVFQPKGTPCGQPKATGCGDACNGAGQCLPNPGAVCTVPTGSYCSGQLGVCNTEGYCAAGLPCGKTYFPKPCADFALGKSCEKSYAIPGYPQSCNAPSGSPTVNSNSCGDAGDPCQPKMCGDGPNAWAICTQGQLPDGAPCPGVAANPCSLATCSGGKCQKAFKTAGTPCTPLAPKQCGPHECNAAGECAGVAPAVPLSGPCTLTDGDTDCWVKSCDSAGNCQKVPRPVGEHCGAVADDACSAHRCDGKGWCVPQLTSEKALCKHSDCLLPTATYGSPCPVGPCVSSDCMKLGLCYTNYKPAGASCVINKIVGTCDADHHCNLTGKGSESVVGKLCIGQFPCMKEDVAYGEDGACHGTIATGEICGTSCKPGICGVDGTCQLSLAPTGTTCGATDYCGKLECDGKGECGFPQASVGTTCGNPGWEKPLECQQYTCNAKGECLTTAAVGKSCKTPSPCLVGTCTKYSKCGYDPISGPACDLAKPDACNTGLCKAGSCEPVPKPGASCQSSGTCTKGVCDLAGQCTQVLDPGAKCPGEDQCLEGQCSGTGACEFSPKPAGSQCTATAPGTDWDCYTGACDGKGGCTLKVNTGATCFQGKAACTKGVCQSDASCKTVLLDAGTPCSNGCMVNAVCTPAGECKGTPVPGKACYDQCLTDATCSAQGECKGVAMVDQPCYGSSKTTLCQSSTCNSQGNCVKSNKVLGTPCEVGAAGYGEVPGYACGSKAGTCNGAGGCVPAFTDPDGSPCGADDGCAKAHVCKGGKCSPVAPRPNGTPCKYGCASGICTAGSCIAGYGMDFGGGPCDDGNVCTFDYCAGAPLPGFKLPSFLPSAPSGECFTTQNSTACPTGKPPKPTPKCLLEGCPVNECGAALICQNPFNEDVDWYCKQPWSNGFMDHPPGCNYDNPCVKVGCSSAGMCTYSPLDYGLPCGAFKYCYKGECKAME